jgi:hypothetical protein
MRPQYNRRVQRAFGALGVVVLGGGVSSAIASAPTASARVTRPARATHVRRHHRPRHLRPARPRRVLLHATMVHSTAVLVGQDVTFVGTTHPRRAHRLVAIQAREGARWTSVARVRTDRSGHFLIRYRPQALGRLRLRARLAGAGGPGTIRSAPVVTVFHQAVASWYGPGGITACGETLTAATQGVANRTLPCGTLVTLRYGNRTVRVPVIDRGPFVYGREYDLTWATKLALGAGDVTVIWASA